MDDPEWPYFRMKVIGQQTLVEWALAGPHSLSARPR